MNVELLAAALHPASRMLVCLCEVARPGLHGACRNRGCGRLVVGTLRPDQQARMVEKFPPITTQVVVPAVMERTA